MCWSSKNVSDLYNWQKNRIIMIKFRGKVTFFITRMRPKKEKMIYLMEDRFFGYLKD